MLRQLLLALVLIFITTACFAQVKKKQHRTLRDSLRERVLKRDSVIRSFRHSDASVNILAGKIEDYASIYVETNADLARGFDTTEISEQLPVLEKQMERTRKAVNNRVTLSYLVSIRGVIDHLKKQLNTWEDQLTDYNNQLDKISDEIVEFKKDSILRSSPLDSNLKVKYKLQVQSLDRQWDDLNLKAGKAIINIGLLENRVSSLTILLIDIDESIDLRVHEFTLKALTNEAGYIWDLKPGYTTSVDTALAKSFLLDYRLYRFFILSKANYFGHTICILVFVLFIGWVLASKRKIARSGNLHHHISSQISYLFKHPFLSAVLLVAVLAPYFYDHAAQIFSDTMVLVLMAAAGPLIKDSWPAPVYKFWLVLFVLAILSTLSSLLILNTVPDRILLIIISAFTIFQSIRFLKEIKAGNESLPKHSRLAVQLFIALHALAVILHITGRFSLAKLIGISATLNICLAMGIYLVVQILMESLFLQLEANKTSDSQTFVSFVDFKIVQTKFKEVLIKLSVILWLLALAKNLTIDDYLYDSANDFLNHPYQFSSTAFTFRSVLIFIIVIWVSGLLARVISYFYDFAGQQTKLTAKDKKTRSSILLIRLAVFVVGFFTAVTAAGIPMDRVTIIIGALGVGIGFGLQNIVNNLVSGIILAFEKPVQVGDIIEVSGISGTIKEIGIRSSKIECGNGSELIVPNGDLISQHVVNWTLSNNNRRVELIIRIAYGSDVVKTEELLASIVNGHKDIMKSPPPAIFLNNFSDTAIEFRVWFWAEEISRWLQLKSGVMREIYIALDEAGIELAQSQKEIQIMLPENISKNDELSSPPDKKSSEEKGK
ncbi:MAG: mechanosensitive ion channel domain-containing protein [Mucilaginibacter sp.]